MVLDSPIHFQQRVVKSFINSQSDSRRNTDPVQPKHSALALALRDQLWQGQAERCSLQPSFPETTNEDANLGCYKIVKTLALNWILLRHAILWKLQTSSCIENLNILLALWNCTNPMFCPLLIKNKKSHHLHRAQVLCRHPMLLFLSNFLNSS